MSATEQQIEIMKDIAKGIAEVDGFLRQQELNPDYSGFTECFIGRMRAEIKQFQREPHTDELRFLSELLADPEMVLEIMRPDLVDYLFYRKLEGILSRLYKIAQAQILHVLHAVRASRAGLN